MYSAYFKQTNYRKLLLSVFVALCAFSVIDYVVVQFISNREVFGIDGRAFAVFGEGTWDVTHQIKNMPLLVLAVSCHDIAGIWVAFFSRCQRYRC